MKNKIVGLFGLNFDSGNMGCQALAYSFCQILLSASGAEKITAYVFVEGDKISEVINAGIQLIPVLYSVKSLNSLLRLKKEIRKCSVVFDFTAGDSFSDLYGFKRFLKVSITKIITILCQKPLILGPQTYGPFKSPSVQMIAGAIIKKSTYVCTRDIFSADLVKKLYGEEVDVFTDVAFSLPYQKPKLERKVKRAGLNVSGLLWRNGYTGDNQFGLKTDYKQYMISLIPYLFSQGYQVHLIPHVITKDYDNPENDVSANDEMKRMFPSVVCAPLFTDPMTAKSYLASMDVFIGARMHATIGAFSSHVATIPFSYSHKFEGLYGGLGYPYLIRALEYDTETALSKTVQYLNGIDHLKQAQDIAMQKIRQNLRLFENRVGELIGEFDE